MTTGVPAELCPSVSQMWPEHCKVQTAWPWTETARSASQTLFWSLHPVTVKYANNRWPNPGWKTIVCRRVFPGYRQFWERDTISTKHSPSIFIFWGDIRRGVQHIGELSPVSISCFTASVWPVGIDPGTGNKSEYWSRTLANWRCCVPSKSRDIWSNRSCRCVGSKSLLHEGRHSGYVTDCMADICATMPTSENGSTITVSWLKFDTRTGTLHLDGFTRVLPKTIYGEDGTASPVACNNFVVSPPCDARGKQ